MNIQEDLKKNKLSLIALHLLTRDHAAEAGLCLEGSVSDICNQAGVNRTQVYEKKAQLTKAFEKIELPEPGRTPKKDTSAFDQDTVGWTLQVTVLKYRRQPRRLRPALWRAHGIQLRLQADHPRSL